ncbi:MAG: methylenetetrahydrofolate reductase [NAD(P)H] [Phycisphaerae bacterium]|nr:methylenetetrahydrofolate reductase [NAD(P)H] [Phycisphaerae bacterium]
MHIREILGRDPVTISYEFFPPKDDAGWSVLFESIREFESLRPSFVSVTYGAGGSTRDRTHDLVVRLRRETSLEPIPHLTCLGHRRDEVRSILERYAQAGVSNLLALRGDPPREGRLEPGDFRHAADLVAEIRRADLGVPGGFGIGVAGFPEGHPETPNTLVQLEHLKAKVDAGADYVCSQMFFDNRVFLDWCDRCRLAGIGVPIIAGIMPITSLAGMRRMADLAGGTRFPAPLLRALDRCRDDPESVARVGTHWATEQCRDLIDQGVRGIHFYTLNRSRATRDIQRTLGLAGPQSLRR